MIIFVLMIIALMLYKIKFSDLFEDYLSKDNTTAIKGIFILFIFLSHIAQYLVLDKGILNTSYEFVRLALGQSVVACFFFFSGYGIYYSLKNKKNYMDGFFKNRICKVLLHFDIALVFYYVLAILMGKRYSVTYTLLGLIGYKSFGNSNWFIFDIIVSYLLVFICFRGKDKKKGLSALTVLSVIFVVIMYFTNESRFYNTFLTFPLGMYYYQYQDKIEAFAKKYYYLIIAFLMGLYGISGLLLKSVYETYEFLYIPLPIIFILGLVILTYKVSFNNKILNYFGVISFEMFIIMRLPMIILSKTTMVNNIYVFIVTTFIITVIISDLYHKALNKFDSIAFKK